MQAEASLEAPVEPETPPPFDPIAYAKTLPGITDPLGFFDPLNFCEGKTEGKIRFYVRAAAHDRA